MTTQHQIRRLAIIILVIGGVALGARELYYARNIKQHPVVVALSEQELISRSDLIIRGRVAGNDGYERFTDPAGELTVGTRWTINSEESLKGLPKASVTVRTLGGRVGLTEVWVEDQPIFTQGESVLVFLRYKSDTDSYEVVGLYQGHFTIDGDEAVQQESGERKPLSEFEALIKAE